MGSKGMNPATRILVWMAVFLAVVAGLCAMLVPQLVQMFRANVFFNSVILGVLVVGIIVNLHQVWRLNHDVRWANAFRRSDPHKRVGERPKLLAPLEHHLSGRDRASTTLSTLSMRAILDSVQMRLDESRDLSRYLISLAIFLGLLGTFWGLLVTIGSISAIVDALEVGSDALLVFGQLKQDLQQPLGGMATSFSTSLFGLSSSLVIGFLDLQAGHAQNRFHHELELWLASMTRLGAGNIVSDGETSVPAYVEALLEQTADGLERMQRSLGDNERERQLTREQLQELGTQLQRMTEALTQDRVQRQQFESTQEDLKTVLRELAARGRDGGLTDDLRSEFRLLARTIAAAGGRGSANGD